MGTQILSITSSTQLRSLPKLLMHSIVPLLIVLILFGAISMTNCQSFKTIYSAIFGDSSSSVNENQKDIEFITDFPDFRHDIEGSGLKEAVVGEQTCFKIVSFTSDGKIIDENMMYIFWTVTVSSVNSPNQTRFLARVDHRRKTGDYYVCYVVNEVGMYRLSIQFEGTLPSQGAHIGSNHSYIDNHKIVKEATVNARRGNTSTEIIENCTPHILSKGHNFFGYWKDNTYQPTNCRLYNVLPPESFSCLGGKTIAVFADSNLKSWLSFFITFLGKDKTFGDTSEDIEYIQKAYELSWHGNDYRTAVGTYKHNNKKFMSGKEQETVFFLDLKLCRRAKVELFGTGWDGYGRIIVEPPCKNQSTITIWLFSHIYADKPLFQKWMEKGSTHRRPWFRRTTRFDYIIAGSSEWDIQHFSDIFKYKIAVTFYMQALRKWVKDGDGNRVIWLGGHAVQKEYNDSTEVVKNKNGLIDGFRTLSFNEAAFKVADKMGVTYLDMHPLSGSRPDLSFDGRHYLWPIAEAETQILLGVLCPQESLISPPDEDCIHQSPNNGSTTADNTTPVNSVGEKLEPQSGGEIVLVNGLDLEEFEVESRRESVEKAKNVIVIGGEIWPSLDRIEKLKSILGKERRVFTSLEDLKIELKKSELMSDTEVGNWSFVESLKHVRIGRAKTFSAGNLNFERATKLDDLSSRIGIQRCLNYRDECINHGTYRKNCPMESPLFEAVAAGVTERCDRWCPGILACYDQNKRASRLFLKVVLRNPIKLKKSPLIARFSEVLISSQGDVYSDTFMVESRGECFGVYTSRMELRIDVPWALEHAHRKVYVADSYGTDVYSVITSGLVRLMPYFKDLLSDTSLLIHVKGFQGTLGTYPFFLRSMMTFLGIKPSRVISHDVYAEEAITTEAPCRAPFGGREITYLLKLRKRIQSRMRKRGLVPLDSRNEYVLLVLNKWHRKIEDYKTVSKYIELITNLTVKFYEDDGEHDVTILWPLFYGASAVIGAYGGGLSHIIACRPGTPILEFMQPFGETPDSSSGNIRYEVLATSLEMPHYSMVPDFVNPFDKGEDGDTFFKVNPRRLASRVVTILEEYRGVRDWRLTAQIFNFTGPSS